MDVYEEAEKIRSKLDRTPFADLSEKDRIILCITGLEAEVNNGGFDQYYRNSAGDFAGFAPQALQTIGAADTADIVSRANAKFGAEFPQDQDTRHDALLALKGKDETLWDALDREFFTYPDDIDELLTEYAEAS